jgi:two-component system, LuxR family, response regulator FixJ
VTNPKLPNPPPIAQIVLLEDDASMRTSLTQVLRFADHTVQAFSSALGFLALSAPTRPTLLITDMRMPGMTGVELQAALLARGWDIPMIFISGESTVQQSVIALKQGAIEFLIKPFGRTELLSAVERGIAINIRQDQTALDNTAYESQLRTLSRRERQVFELLAAGYSNAELVKSLGVSLPTAKQYKAEVMRKLNLRSLSELIQLHNGRQNH